MSDITRAALKGGGKIHIMIDARPSGDFDLRIEESWARLTAVKRYTIPAQQLETAEDPDGLIREEVVRLVRKAHMNWEASMSDSATAPSRDRAELNRAQALDAPVARSMAKETQCRPAQPPAAGGALDEL